MIDESTSLTQEQINPSLPVSLNANRDNNHWWRDWLEAILFACLIAFALKVFVVEAYRIPSGSMEDTLLIGDFLLVNKFIYGARIPFTDSKLPAVKSVTQGDVVVFKFPRDPESNYIKRCVAIAGQQLEIRDKILFVNGEQYLLDSQTKVGHDFQPKGLSDGGIFPHYSSFNRDNYGPIQVPKQGDSIFLNESNFYLYKYLLEYEGHTVSMMGGIVYLDGKPTREYVVQQNYYFMLGDNRDFSLDSRYWGFLPESYIIGSAMIIYWSWNPNVQLTNLATKINSIRWERIGQLIL